MSYQVTQVTVIRAHKKAVLQAELQALQTPTKTNAVVLANVQQFFSATCRPTPSLQTEQREEQLFTRKRRWPSLGATPRDISAHGEEFLPCFQQLLSISRCCFRETNTYSIHQYTLSITLWRWKFWPLGRPSSTNDNFWTSTLVPGNVSEVHPPAIASNLRAMASNLRAMASNLRAMASNQRWPPT